jgi:Flp pilus assembly pilin Flp
MQHAARSYCITAYIYMRLRPSKFPEPKLFFFGALIAICKVSQRRIQEDVYKSAETFLSLKGTQMDYLKRILRDEEGQDMVEYGLLGAFISIVAIAALRAIGPLVNTVYVNIQNALS